MFFIFLCRSKFSFWYFSSLQRSFFKKIFFVPLICSYEFSQLLFGRRRKSFALSLKDVFTGYRIIGLESFSFLSESNILCLLACLVSDDKSRVIFVFVSLCVCVPPQHPQPHIYISLYCWFLAVWLCFVVVFFFKFLLLGFCWTSWIYGFIIFPHHAFLYLLEYI